MTDDSDIRRAIRELKIDVANTKGKLEDQREENIKNTLRLENGEKAFKEIRSKLPVPMSQSKLLTLAFAIFTASGAALWSLASYLSDRPTHEQTRSNIETHDQHGHQSLRQDIRKVQTEQAAQRVIIDSVKTDIGKQDKKLDVLIKQTRRKRR